MTRQGLDYEFQITNTKICFVNGLFSHYKEMTLDFKIPRGMPEGGWGGGSFLELTHCHRAVHIAGEGGGRGSEIPTSHTLYSHFLPSSTVVPTSLYFFCCKKLHNLAKFISYFSRLLPLWVSRLLPSLLLPPIDLQPPFLPGSCPSVPRHLTVFLVRFLKSKSHFKLLNAPV